MSPLEVDEFKETEEDVVMRNGRGMNGDHKLRTNSPEVRKFRGVDGVHPLFVCVLMLNVVIWRDESMCDSTLTVIGSVAFVQREGVALVDISGSVTPQRSRPRELCHRYDLRPKKKRRLSDGQSRSSSNGLSSFSRPPKGIF